MALTPEPPLPCRRYSLTSVFLPYPLDDNTNSIQEDSAENKVPFKSQEFSLHPALLNSPNEFSKKEVEYYTLQEKTHSNSTNISRKELEKNLEKFLISWLGDFKKLKELASKIEPHKLDMKL